MRYLGLDVHIKATVWHLALRGRPAREADHESFRRGRPKSALRALRRRRSARSVARRFGRHRGRSVAGHRDRGKPRVAGFSRVHVGDGAPSRGSLGHPPRPARRPRSAHDRQSVVPRTGANPITGDAIAPVVQACDCFPQDLPASRPLCHDPASPTIGIVQYYAKAYPGLRQLEVLRELGDQAVVASICPKLVAGDADNPSFGYSPAVHAILHKLDEAIGDVAP